MNLDLPGLLGVRWDYSPALRDFAFGPVRCAFGLDGGAARSLLQVRGVCEKRRHDLKQLFAERGALV